MNRLNRSFAVERQIARQIARRALSLSLSLSFSLCRLVEYKEESVDGRDHSAEDGENLSYAQFLLANSEIYLRCWDSNPYKFCREPGTISYLLFQAGYKISIRRMISKFKVIYNIYTLIYISREFSNVKLDIRYWMNNMSASHVFLIVLY